MPLAFWLALAALVLALIAAFPWLLERRRAPMADAVRAEAPGDFVALGKGTTHYRWHGPRTRKVAVLIHGLSIPSWVLEPLAERLVAEGYHVLSYDLYGRGFSDRPKGAQDREFFTDQLGELLDEMGLAAPVVLVGYSMGGAIATAFAAEHPDRVERLMLLAPAGLGYTPTGILPRASGLGLWGDWLWGLFGARLLRRWAKWDGASSTCIGDFAAMARRDLRLRGFVPAILNANRHMLTEDMAEAHREIAGYDLPVLAIWGEADPIIPISALGRLAECNRHAHQQVIPNAGHAIPHSHPDRIIAHYRDFLRAT